jgi:ABC-type proline/glycine betaine transport system permease subunit
MRQLRLPLAPVVDNVTTYLTIHMASVFDGISAIVLGIVRPLENGILFVPQWLAITIAAFIGVIMGGGRLGLTSVACLLFISSLDLWEPAVATLALVGTATALAIVFGLAVGVLMAESRSATAVLTPVLDFMQTMPAFVLLIPSVMFFGVGTVAGVISTVIYAMPPAVRLTAHGLTIIEREMLDAGEAFGCGRARLLYLVKLPLAVRTIMAGINQCIMMALSMVVIAAMIGAGGLGEEIIRAIARLQVGRGVEGGLAVVALAILLDRLSRSIGKRLDPVREPDEDVRRGAGADKGVRRWMKPAH